jgi:hypothetical protein
MTEPAISKIITDAMDGHITAAEATEAIERVLITALAPYTVEHAAGYYSPTADPAARKWKQVWPPIHVWCQSNGGHCPSEAGTCKHCGALMAA